MNTPLFIIIPVLIISIIILAYFFSKKAKIKRKLRNAEFRKIANFKNGEIAKIVGKVKFVSSPLYAPLTNRKCAHYYVHVEKQQSSGKSSTWNTIIEEEVSSKFLIKDEDHYAIINDTFIKSYIVQDERFSSGFLDDAPKQLEKYLKSKGHESEGFLGFNKTLRYKEGILEENEEIAVYGKGQWKDADTLDLPESLGKVLEITSDNNLAVHISDDPDTTIKHITKKKKNLKKDYHREKHYRK